MPKSGMSYESMVKEGQSYIKKTIAKSQITLTIGFLCSIFIANLFWQHNQNKENELHYLDQNGISHTLTLPVKDKKRLAGLMQKLFAENNFAYTLLGNKPLSWETYQNPLPLSNLKKFYGSFSERNQILRRGWKTWEKYKHLFPTSHLWSECPHPYPGLVSILIINENQFNDTVNKNKKDFQEVLGREIQDGFQLISESKNKSLIHEVLQGHQALIGIVLGYGVNNSWLFLEGCKNRTPIGWVWGEGKEYLIEESKTSDLSLTDYYLSHYSCPSFSGDPYSEESLALKKSYLLTKQKVLDYYKDKDFLEATLSLLAGYRPDCEI